LREQLLQSRRRQSVLNKSPLQPITLPTPPLRGHFQFQRLRERWISMINRSGSNERREATAEEDVIRRAEAIFNNGLRNRGMMSTAPRTTADGAHEDDGALNQSRAFVGFATGRRTLLRFFAGRGAQLVMRCRVRSTRGQNVRQESHSRRCRNRIRADGGLAAPEQFGEWVVGIREEIAEPRLGKRQNLNQHGGDSSR